MRDVTLVILNSLRIKCHIRRPLKYIQSPLLADVVLDKHSVLIQHVFLILTVLWCVDYRTLISSQGYTEKQFYKLIVLLPCINKYYYYYYYLTRDSGLCLLPVTLVCISPTCNSTLWRSYL